MGNSYTPPIPQHNPQILLHTPSLTTSKPWVSPTSSPSRVSLCLTTGQRPTATSLATALPKPTSSLSRPAPTSPLPRSSPTPTAGTSTSPPSSLSSPPCPATPAKPSPPT